MGALIPIKKGHFNLLTKFNQIKSHQALSFTTAATYKLMQPYSCLATEIEQYWSCLYLGWVPILSFEVLIARIQILMLLVLWQVDRLAHYQ